MATRYSHILIAGCGVSGKGAARLASHLNLSYSICDQKDTSELRDFAKSLKNPPERTLFGWTEGTALPNADVVVLSPGIRAGAFRSALEKSSPQLIGELEFALNYLPCPYVGITGTNGKTTTTELTTALFQAYGIRCASAGNIGDSLSDVVIRSIEEELKIVIIEISSFQLETMEHLEPAAGAVLNLASDHIDRHHSMEDYARTKFKLLCSTRQGHVINSNLTGTANCLMPSGSQYVTFSASDRSAYYTAVDGCLRRDGKMILALDEMNLKGAHNAENALAALALLEAVEGADAVNDDRVLTALRTFRSGAHRIECFLEKDGITYIDDSKATNPHAVNAALEAVSGPVILILGGLDKGMDFTELLPHLSRVRCAFCIGQSGQKICSIVSSIIPAQLCSTFEEAVEKAVRSACKGNTVMLSPACASMDMFKDYKDRGEQFKRLVRHFLEHL